MENKHEHENDAEIKENHEETQSSATSEIETLKRDLQQAKERAAYLGADFENYRKRMEKERLATFASAQGVVLADVLTIVDDFDRAFAELQQKQLLDKPEFATYLSGFELIYKSLQKMLQKYGVTEIEAKGSFNPELHEAVMQVDEPNLESGMIVSVLQKGYLFKGVVVRPAKVSVKP
jgi:molecular chaperone GrpE